MISTFLAMFVTLMRLTILTSIASILASCSVANSKPEDHSVITYYDRDNDGVVDYELHRVPGTTYWTWALVDSKCSGRYDRRLRLAYPFDSERVNLPVPRHVKITPGMPPYESGDPMRYPIRN